ncbi:hypothetical protein [Haloplanus pelagicus]|uniref:hypothetical protein n=1 Tax=Haloplanus pelagicus TaxID=2949995 RepID=UPI002041F638|nr:hypothetical protein [Haloplanus sp. HW8-1]
MANDPDPETPVSVSTGEVRVGKSFEADRFPVPAIAFEIESLDDDPIRIRLVDRIPESFAMEGVGFHPDYDSDNWTAYRDHRVAYERTLDPGESVLTVYGIRIDDPEEAEPFLDEPTIELIEPDDVGGGTEDVLGRETTQAVRDALSGEESSDLSELAAETESAPEPLLDDGDVSDDPTPRDREAGLDTAIRDRDEGVTRVDVTEGTDSPEDEDDGTDEAVPSADAAEALDPRPTDDTGATETADGSDDVAGTTADDVDAEPETPTAAPGSVAAALAAEIRQGTVDDDDLAVLHEAFEGEVPTSVDVRVGRLQSQVEDVLAYRDALADFLDENGTAEDVLGDVSEEVSDLNDRIDDLDGTLATAAEDRAALRDEVGEVSDAVDDVADRVDGIEDDLDRVESRLGRLDERLADAESMAEDIEEIHTELDELRSFRDRLSSAFGTGEE